MSSCYDIQNTDKPYLFSLIQTQITADFIAMYTPGFSDMIRHKSRDVSPRSK